MWSTRAGLEAALRDAGLGDWAQGLALLARHCIVFVPGAVENETAAPLGACRLGGEPDMPADIEWPFRPPFKAKLEWAGTMPGRALLGPGHSLHRLLGTRRWREASEGWERSRRAEKEVRNRAWPLSFVAQIDFAELHAVQPLDSFPSAGRLLLFCDAFDWPWGEREDQARMRVVYTEEPPERLQRRRSPREFDEPEARTLMPRGFVFKPRVLRPEAWLLPPQLQSIELAAFKAEQPGAWAYQQPVELAYDRFWANLYASHPDTFGPGGETIHQAGGAAVAIQGPVEAECAKLAEAVPAPLAGADDWQLVLQIDSDIEAGMEWGDVGRLYLCARRQDLAARRFDRCCLVTQCY